jgi:hypothetical protein
MKFIRIIAIEIRKYFKNKDVFTRKKSPHNIVLSLIYQKIYLINIYV